MLAYVCLPWRTGGSIAPGWTAMLMAVLSAMIYLRTGEISAKKSPGSGRGAVLCPNRNQQNMNAQERWYSSCDRRLGFEQIHRLNYRTFVEEIPSTNPPPPSGSWTNSTPRTPI